METVVKLKAADANKTVREFVGPWLLRAVKEKKLLNRILMVAEKREWRFPSQCQVAHNLRWC